MRTPIADTAGPAGPLAVKPSSAAATSGIVIAADSEDDLVTNVQQPAREHDNTELSREHILAELHGEPPDNVHRRIGL